MLVLIQNNKIVKYCGGRLSQGYLLTDRYKPMFNLVAMERLGVSKELIKDKFAHSLSACLADPKVKECLLKFGENEGGKEVVYLKDFQERKAVGALADLKKGVTVLNFVNGYFGYRLNERVAKELFDILRPHAEYIAGNAEQMDWLDQMDEFNVTKSEVKGWYYKKGSLQALLDLGIRVSLNGEEIKKEK